MQIIFTRWAMRPQDRTNVSVDPKRVDITEHYADAFPGSDVSEAMPAATKIIMKNKQTYYVQGLLSDVVEKLNAAEEA